MQTEAEKKFIIGLEKLTRETGIAIGGCGCCGSPFLFKADITSEESGYSNYVEITWTDPTDKIFWNQYAKYIVKEK